MKKLLSHTWAVGLGKISSSSRFTRGRGPGARERLGFFPSPPDIFSKGHFPNVTSSKGGVGGFAKYQFGRG